MKKVFWTLVLCLFLIPLAYAVCVDPVEGSSITTSTEFCQGDHPINVEMTVDASDLVLTCNNTVFNITTANSIVALRVLASNITIKGCTFDSNAPDAMNGLNLSTGIGQPYDVAGSLANNSNFINNTFVNIYYGIYFQDTVSSPMDSESISVINNTFNHVGVGFTLSQNSSKNLKFNNNRMVDIGGAPTQIQLVSSLKNIEFIGNRIINTFYGALYAATNDPTGIDNATVSNNYVSGLGMIEYGTQNIFSLTTSNGGVVSNVMINNNTVENIYGYAINLQNKLANISVVNNTINNSMYNTMHITPSQGADNILIDGNVLTNTGNFTLNLPSDGVFNIRISNNKIFGADDYAIKVYAPSGDITITGNIIQMNPDAHPDAGQYGVYFNDQGGMATVSYSNNQISAPNGVEMFLSRLTKVTMIGGGNEFTAPPGIWPNNLNNIFLGQGIISINASEEPSLNVSTNVTLNLGSSICPATIYYYPSFTKSFSTIKSSGQVCNGDSDPACTNIQCSGNTLTFTVPHFDSYGAEGIVNVPEFNLTTMLLVMIITLFGVSLLRKK